MIIEIENFQGNFVNLLRQAGYTFKKREKKEMVFVRLLSRSGFPRFHLFAYINQDNLIINIHLDQKKETYGKEVRHHGKYEDSELLKKEMERIKKFFSGL